MKKEKTCFKLSNFVVLVACTDFLQKIFEIVQFLRLLESLKMQLGGRTKHQQTVIRSSIKAPLRYTIRSSHKVDLLFVPCDAVTWMSHDGEGKKENKICYHFPGT